MEFGFYGKITYAYRTLPSSDGTRGRAPFAQVSVAMSKF